MKLTVFHRTHYAYAAAVQDSFNEARLQPCDHARQRRHSFLLKVLPATRLTHYQDLYGNCVHLFDVSRPHTALTVEATSTVTTAETPNLPEDAALAPLATLAECLPPDRCYDFLQPSQFVNDHVEAWRLALDYTAGTTDAWLAALQIMRQLHRDFTYEPAATHVHTTVKEALRLRKGVCQDFAHVMTALCRALKIPARYVSGYLYNGPAEHLKGAQASHAWVEVYIPGHGWRGLDPTNNQQVDGRYVIIGTGRDYADVPPLKGTYRGTQERKMTVEVLVTQVDAHATPDGDAAVRPAS